MTTIVQRRLEAIAEETAVTLLRSTRSPLLNQAGDLGTAILDAEGRLLAGAEYIPIIAMSLRMACAGVREFFGDDVHPGDVILHNDVFSGGLQNNDAGALIPVFDAEELIGWIGCKGHLGDIGGPIAGGCNPNATEVWQEALRIPPVKVYERGTFRPDVWNLIFANVRSRSSIEADVRAQIGACRVGARELAALVHGMGRESFNAHAADLLDASERMMRSAIAEIPDGDYHGSSAINVDADGTLRTFRIEVTASVRGDRLRLDYTGTDPQAGGYTNAPLASSLSATLMALLMMVGPDMPHNEGTFGAVDVHIPEGTILNCRFPAATFYGNFMSVQNSDAVMAALADALPERVTAEWARPYVLRTSGIDPRSGRQYHDIHFLGLKGGAGATYGVDGYNQAAPIFCPQLRTHDYELNEIQDPHFLLKHEYLVDSAGAGRWRGGLGVEYEVRIDAEMITAVTQGDGLRVGARGVHGGRDSICNSMELVRPDGSTHVPRAMEILGGFATGTVVRQRASGGGGYGDPFDRPAELVLDDVRNGFVSLDSADRDYGVVLLRDGLTYTIDEAATERRRGERRTDT
jgi:N-methylhydantoinase B